MKITKNPIVLLVSMGFFMGIVGCAHFRQGEQCKIQHKVDVANEAQISVDQAIQTASQQVQGTIVEVELEKEEGDTAVWEVYSVTTDGKLMEVEIDAKSGEVLEVEEEKAD